MGIESKNFSLDVDLLAYSGIVFSPEQRAALQTSMVILKEQYKFKSAHLWGKILGISDDYFIIQGRAKNELKDRQFLYSKDCINWSMLTPATEEAKELSPTCQGRFTGDASHEFEVKKFTVTNEGTEEENVEEEKSRLREEERLAAVLWQIEQDSLIIPRGSYILQPNGDVERNRTFEGLTTTEAGKLRNYFHFREPIQLQQKSLLFRASLDKSTQFLDTIDEDIPKGSWSIQYERGSGLIQIRSLKWLGMSFFHIPETNRYGSLYCGIGEENKDLPFMI
ncbi:unnamed protein product [Didymodactylos carnosus]|uniref:Radial spoke head protein 9 homolog n=1 Tax=Didymodactylos carnosus TaxID=1234261 RepID=A0A814NN12_9BILA|nr:unnamed protein product [Didymodactylos carnosus]CAF3859891.1 unnamed protein product [Didymodactylos carnosus]